MSAPPSRPSDADLRAFLLGTLSSPDADRVGAWVECDPAAAAALHPLDAADTLTGALAGSTQIELPAAADVDRAVAAALDTRAMAGDATPAGPLPLPARFGTYRVVRELGRGGMGVVYEAEDERLGRRVAVKVMGPESAASDTASGRFLREARTAASLSHDHIVTIHHVGEEAGVPYIAMPLLAGQSLEDRLKVGEPLPVAEAVRIGRETAAGLAAAHAVGLTHRDIKPANLWLEAPRGRVKILDFGLARSRREGDAITRSGLAVGTPAYMAPEQAAGKTVDHRADLFSLGAVLYQITTGRRPFDGPDVMAVLHSLATETPPAANAVNPAVPSILSDLIGRMIARDPARRPASSDEVAAELSRIDATVAQPPAAADSRTIIVPARRRTPGRVRFAQALLAVLVVATAAGIVIKIKNKDGTETEIKVPEGATVTVEKDGKTVAAVGPAPKTDGGKPTVPWKPIPIGESPFDKLDPKGIPAAERFDWEHEQNLPLVAVIGSHRQRVAGGGISSLAVSPNGKIVIAQHWPFGGTIWRNGLDGPRITTGDQRWRFDGGERGSLFINDVTVLSGDKVLDVSGTEPKVIGKTPIFADRYACSRDGKVVLAWRNDQRGDEKLHLLDTSDLASVRELPAQLVAQSGALSPDGKVVAVLIAGEKVVRLFDFDGTKLAQRAGLIRDALTWGNAVAFGTLFFLGDGRLGVCHADGVFRVWDVSAAEPKELAKATENQGLKVGSGYWAVASPDGTRVAICNQTEVEVWRFEADRLTLKSKFAGEHSGMGPLGPVAFRTNGLVAAGHLYGAVTQWDVTKDQAVQIDPVPGGIAGKFEVSPDGSTLIAIGEDSRVRRYTFGGPEPKSKPLRDELVFNNYLRELGTISPDGSLVCCQGRALRPADRAPDWREYLTELSPFGSRTGFSDEGRHVVHLVWKGTDYKASVSPFSDDLSKGFSEWATLPRKCGWPFLLPDGRHFVAGEDRIGLYTYFDGKIALTDEVAPVNLFRGSVAATPDGKTLALFGDNVQWFSVEADKLKEIKKPFSYWDLSGSVGACYSRDDKLVAFYGNSVRVFDRETGKKLHEWKWPSPPRRALFAPDGRHLLVNNFDGTLYVLRLGPG